MHKVQVATGNNNITLPNGKTYNSLQYAYLTDQEFEQLRPTLFTNGILIDLGEDSTPGTDGTVTDQGSLSTSIVKEWRDEFTNTPIAADWGVDAGGSYVAALDGNAAGVRYLKVTLDPRDPTAYYRLYGKRSFPAPFRIGWGISISRRTVLQETWIGAIGINADGTPLDSTPPYTAATLTGGIVVVSNVATATSTTAHGFHVGQRVVIAGNADPRVNALVVITGVPSPTTFTYSYTIGNATYGAAQTGTATHADATTEVKECIGIFADDSTSGNAKVVTRTNGATSWIQAWNPGNTWETAVIPNSIVNYAANYTYAQQPRYAIDIYHEGDWAGVNLVGIDGLASPVSYTARDQNLPTPDYGFVPRFSTRNVGLGYIPQVITVASKSASTTATLTIPSHGLTTSDWIAIYGIRDQTNFANQTTAVQVASVVNANQITVVFGASATATSYGGVVYRFVANTSSVNTTSAIQSVQPVVASSRLQVNFLAAQGTWNVGESVLLTGLVNSSNVEQTAYEGLYRVASSNTGTFIVELEPLQGQALPGGTITAGGTLQIAPDVRLHFLRLQAHTRTNVEVESSKAHGRIASSAPVAIMNAPSVTATISGTPNVAITSANNSMNIAQVVATSAANLTAPSASKSLGVGLTVASATSDRASSAITASGNTGTIADDFGQAISGLIAITAASGTTPTIFFQLQESNDNGTTWHDVWHSPILTTTGTIDVPLMLVGGRRRWAWTVTGTTPSFTTSITTMRSNSATSVFRQFVDRTIAPNALSFGTAYQVGPCSLFSLFVRSGAGATVSPVYGVQTSIDGVNFFDSGISLTLPASTNLAGSVTVPIPCMYARIYIKTAGTGAVHTEAYLTASTS